MSSDDQANSDPLPYTQVDRAVKPKATLLAGMIGKSPQHALGSLVEFWDLFGDPREIEKLVAEGKREVIAQRSLVASRFEAASGVELPPEKLVGLGLLEARGEDLFRVRGMSRYFQPIERRLRARAAAVAGGKARAAAGRGKDGRFGPVTGAGRAAGPAAGLSAGESAGVSAGEPLVGRLDIAPASYQPSTTTADSVSGQLQRQGEKTRPAKAGGGGKLKAPDPRHAPLVKLLCDTFERETRAPYPFAAEAGRNAAAVSALLASGLEPSAINAALVKALRSKAYPMVRTFPELAKHLPHFVGTTPAAGSGKGAAWTQSTGDDDGGFLAGLERP